MTPAGEAGGIRGLWGRARESMAAYVPPTRDQITMFLGLLAGGALFLTMAFFFVFPPVIILSPQKFALSFTIGACGPIAH